MDDKDFFLVEGNGSQDSYTLYSLSLEFLQAAKVLQDTPPTKIGYDSATYYLLGHAAELMLKAFLFNHCQCIKELRIIGHDLKKLTGIAREKGLPDKIDLAQILDLAAPYKSKALEYRAMKKLKLPPIDLLTEEIDLLSKHVFDSLTI